MFRHGRTLSIDPPPLLGWQNVRVSKVNRATKAASLSVSFTVGLYGIAFGAAGIAAGFSILQTVLLSLLTFSGASQFAVVGVIGAGGSALSAVTTASLLGFRNALYGMRMAPLLKLKGVKKIVGAQVTIDESTGVALGQSDLGEDAMRAGFWLTGIGVYIFWNFFTVLGALGAQSMGDPSAWGLDAAVPAAFLGLVWPRLHTRFEQSLAIAAISLSLLLTPFVPAGIPIISTAILAVIFGWKVRP
jgi:predicted branched-subunit amino acid permease